MTSWTHKKFLLKSSVSKDAYRELRKILPNEMMEKEGRRDGSVGKGIDTEVRCPKWDSWNPDKAFCKVVL